MFKEIGAIDIDEWMLGSYNGQYEDGSYVITDKLAYLKDKYESYSYTKGKRIAGVLPHKQSSLEADANNCTLTSISTICEYYKNEGYMKIPDDITLIYKDVREIAVGYGYKPDYGTFPTKKINNIVEDSFKKWGYTCNSTNYYLYSWWGYTNEINNDRPFVLNLTSGTYSNHSITVYGYNEYDVPGVIEALFLLVYDNWSTSTRYIDYNVMLTSTLESYTTIKPKKD